MLVNPVDLFSVMQKVVGNHGQLSKNVLASKIQG